MSDITPLQHECPMCGEKMRLRHHDRVRHLPGLAEEKTEQVAEWECPECDYFEEYDGEQGNA